MKFQTVRKRIFATTLILVMVPLLIISIFCCLTSYNTSVQLVTNDIERLATVSSNLASWELRNYLTLAESSGLNRNLSSGELSEEEKLAALKNMTDNFNVDRGNIIRLDGIEITEGKDFTSREYYINALQGKSTITEPFTSALTGQTTTIIAAPLWSEGRSGTDILGCVYYAVDYDFLSEIMEEICMTDNSSAYIFNASGKVIAQYPARNLDQDEATLAAEDQTMLNLYNNVVTSTNGVETFKLNGTKQIVGYSSIEGINGWTTVVCAPVSDFTSEVILSIIIDIILCLLTLVLIVIISNRLGRSIGKPIQECTERIRKLAEGDLQTPVPQLNSADETGVLCNSTQEIVDKIKMMITDIDRILIEMSNSNFDVHSNIGDDGYPGDFHSLLNSMRAINRNLSSTILEIDQAASLVSSHSQQVSSAAQALGQGTVEQAASVEDLENDMRDLSGLVQQNADNANTANVRVVEVGHQIQESNEKMSEMITAMSEINKSSDEISKIIKTIEDIAFQTNILALNAAVEAARAGTAGKGFAVVADEVRNLATKSDQAAKATKDLISHSIASVDDGTRIANETAVQLAAVVEGANSIIQNIGEIAEASHNQAQGVSQIKDRLSQIAAVVQTNSATAQESAATAEELQSQSNIMKTMVDKFKIREV